MKAKFKELFIMATSRRTFLKNGLIATAAVGAPLALSQAAAAAVGRTSEPDNAVNGEVTGESERDLTGQTSKETFTELIGTQFVILEKNNRALTLGEVKDSSDAGHESYPVSDTRESFRLIFNGPGARLPEGLYTFTHEAIGTFNMFISPAGVIRGKQSYQAYFNRI